MMSLRALGSLITATLLGIGDYVGLHVVFRRTKLSIFLSIIPPQLLGFYKVANTVLLSISEPRVREGSRRIPVPESRGTEKLLGSWAKIGVGAHLIRRNS